MEADNLSSLLWRERGLLDLVIYRLETERLLLTSGKTKWLQHATGEIEQVVQKLRETGLLRTLAVSSVALDLGINEDASLSDLADASPTPWDSLFRSHLQAMTGQAVQIKQLRDANEQLLRAAARSTQETMSTLVGETGTYDALGTTGKGIAFAGGHIFDAEL